jgi:hypothetical protein
VSDERAALFERIRRSAGHAQPHPGAVPGTGGAARFAAFASALAAAGAEVNGPLPRRRLGPEVAARARAWARGGRIVAEPSAAELLESEAFEMARAHADPHAFADVAVGIARGCLGVAEDGAVAVLGRDAPDRALLFLAERLILLLDARRLVPDLHAAFRALPADALGFHHLTWISGPSKTADIELTLVRGAHGPRALAVFTYESHGQTGTLLRSGFLPGEATKA